MKKKISIIFAIILVLALAFAIFSGVFYENFGIVRGLRARHLLKTNPQMREGLKANVPISMKIEEITAKYTKEIDNLKKIRNDARNDFFKLPKDTRDTSEEGIAIKYIYLEAVYDIVLLENQMNLEVSELNLERYSNGKKVRLENIK